MLNVPSEVLSANMVDTAKKMEIQVDWIDKAIHKIIVRKEHYALCKRLFLWKTIGRYAKARWNKPYFVYHILKYKIATSDLNTFVTLNYDIRVL